MGGPLTRLRDPNLQSKVTPSQTLKIHSVACAAVNPSKKIHVGAQRCGFDSVDITISLSWDP